MGLLEILIKMLLNTFFLNLQIQILEFKVQSQKYFFIWNILIWLFYIIAYNPFISFSKLLGTKKTMTLSFKNLRHKNVFVVYGALRW